MSYVLTDLQDADIYVNLMDGRFTIGSGDGDAIYMPDTAGAVPEHLKLVFYDGVLTLLAASDSIWVNSVKVSAFPFDVHAGDVISLSPDCHMAFTEDGKELPAIPVIEQEADEVLFANVDKKVMMRYIKLAVIGAVGALAILLGSAILGDKPPKEEEPAPVISQEISQEQVQNYLQETFGKNLLSVTFTDEECLIWLDGNPAVNHNPVKEQMEGVLNKMIKPRKAVIEVIDIKKLTETLTTEFKNKGLAINEANDKITISGVMPPKLVSETNAQILAANSRFHGFKEVVSEVKADDRYNIKLVSVLIGAKEVSATLRYKDTWTIVPEGGKVFGIGTLKLVRPTSIVVATAYGDMTYGL